MTPYRQSTMLRCHYCCVSPCHHVTMTSHRSITCHHITKLRISRHIAASLYHHFTIEPCHQTTVLLHCHVTLAPMATHHMTISPCRHVAITPYHHPIMVPYCTVQVYHADLPFVHFILPHPHLPLLTACSSIVIL